MNKTANTADKHEDKDKAVEQRWVVRANDALSAVLQAVRMRKITPLPVFPMHLPVPPAGKRRFDCNMDEVVERNLILLAKGRGGAERYEKGSSSTAASSHVSAKEKICAILME